MRKLSILVLIIGAALATPAAQADQPIITPAPGADFVDTTTCAFPVSIHYTVNGETAKTFSSGKVIVTGPLAAQFSANGKSVTLNIAGPATITPTSDGSVTVIGHGVGAGPTLLANGQTTLAYNAGTVDISGPAGVIIHGHILLDICAALAS